MKIGVPKEIVAHENRVALIPETVGRLTKMGVEVLVEKEAGQRAGFLDEAYTKAGAVIAPDAASLFGGSDLVLKIREPVMNEATAKHEIDLMRPGTALAAILQPLVNTELVEHLARARITAFHLDSIPRITTAQSMDVLSSMSTVAGYKRRAAGQPLALTRMFFPCSDRHGTLAAGQSVRPRRRRRRPAGHRHRAAARRRGRRRTTYARPSRSRSRAWAPVRRNGRSKDRDRRRLRAGVVRRDVLSASSGR